jgi:heme-degrading monooxygenase HmoA
LIVEYIRYKVDLDRAEPFVQAYQLASRALDQSEFCRAYELSECTENKRFFVLRILWDSLKAHLEGFSSLLKTLARAKEW